MSEIVFLSTALSSWFEFKLELTANTFRTEINVPFTQIGKQKKDIQKRIFRKSINLWHNIEIICYMKD